MNLSDRQLKPNPDVIFTIVDDEAILLEQTTGKYYSLNQVGTRIWVLLEEYGQLEKIQELLLAEFEVEEEQLKEDLERLVSKLLENGLLT
jgi:hypothetical protein